MKRVSVTLRTDRSDVPPCVTEGFAPDENCPLAVTQVASFFTAVKEWQSREQWVIVHRPTGFFLGEIKWPTRAAAFNVLLACDPGFAAWPLAKGGKEDPASVACFYKFRMAVGGTVGQG